MARDITEGRSTRAIAVDIGLNATSVWQNTGNTYDCAIAGIPFLLAIKDDRPYERATSPFRKQQFDSQRDPGEQSLGNWWLRSQSSFHAGEGIIFYDPLSNPYSDTISTNSYRVKESYGVDIWTQGQVTLLNDTTQGHVTLTPLDATTNRPKQRIFSAKWVDAGVTKQGFILHDGYDLDRIDSNGNVEHWVDYNTGSADPVFAACSDGKTMYWVTNDTVNGKLRVEKKAISASTSTPATTMFTHPSGETVTNAAIAYVKQRIVLAANNKIYEFPTSQATMPSATYTHPSTSYVFTSITESGTAIYVSGFEGIKSSIFKFNLDTTTYLMPVTTAAITAAELPVGEVVHRIFTYLGYMMIGTSKGIRVATIDTYGSITYGPILVHTTQAVYDFCARDSFVWCATGVNTEPGLIRVDLATELGQGTMRFAYAHDIHYDDYVGFVTTTCGFIGDTDQIAFATANNGTADGHVYAEHPTRLRNSGYIETGLIRYNTLEPKNFKRVVARGDFSHGSMTIVTRDLATNLYDVVSYDAVIGSPEVTITQPQGAQDAIGLRFVLYRDSDDNTKGAVFKGYQLKAVPATPRTRIITVPLSNFDTETDKYNSTIGYEGRAIERLAALENAEANGDVVTWQDFRSGELAQCLIEEVKFTDITPPDKRLTGYGGIITLTIRTV